MYYKAEKTTLKLSNLIEHVLGEIFSYLNAEDLAMPRNSNLNKVSVSDQSEDASQNSKH